MAGRGFLNEAAPLPKDMRLKVLRNGRWQPMFRPVNPDRPFSGTCLAERFAIEYAREHNVDTGIIPCADGGTTLQQWREGGLLFDHAVLTAKLSMRTSELTAIRWHQGEGDCEASLYPHYEEKFTGIAAALRRELGAEDIPFLVGGLGDFLKNRAESPALANYPHVNEALKRVAASSPKMAYVSAEGLGSNPDNLHFSAAALDEFGLRYYEAFKALEDKERIFTEKASMDDAVRTAMEAL